MEEKKPDNEVEKHLVKGGFSSSDKRPDDHEITRRRIEKIANIKSSKSREAKD